MIALRFLGHFITLVMGVVRSCMFSIIINGQLEGFFPGKKGLRQGDLISLLLFILCMDYLSRTLKKMTVDGFSFHRGCEVLKLSHLCFADNLMVFSNGDGG